MHAAPGGAGLAGARGGERRRGRAGAGAGPRRRRGARGRRGRAAAAPPLGGLPAARRAGARLRERGLPAARGPVGSCGSGSTRSARRRRRRARARWRRSLGAAASAGAPCPPRSALPLARTEALDRVLGVARRVRRRARARRRGRGGRAGAREPRAARSPGGHDAAPDGRCRRARGCGAERAGAEAAARSRGSGSARPAGRVPDRAGGERGQALLLLVAAMCAALVAALVLGGVARGLGAKGRNQRAADLAALGGARTMRAATTGCSRPRSSAGGRTRSTSIVAPTSAGRASGRSRRPRSTAASASPSPSPTPTRSRRRGSASPSATRQSSSWRVGGARAVVASRRPSSRRGAHDGVRAGAGEYGGPLAYRQGKPMRPDVALAFDRLAAAAARDGVSLIVVSGFRSNAEQARLFAAHPDPSGSRRPARRCTGSAPSSTSGRRARTAGWRPTRRASAS